MIEYERCVDVFDSKNVESIAYSMKHEVMKVRFKTTAEYTYSNVKSYLFGAIIASDNVGQFLYTMISSKPDEFPYERIDI
jgi:hypothetical protein